MEKAVPKPTRNLKKFLRELEKLNLPKDKFAVFGGGVLAVWGIRETNDLDLVVLPELWEILVKKYPAEKTDWGGKIHLTGNIEAVEESKIGSVEETIKSADVIFGFRFVNLKLMKEWKKKMGREKDLRDIKLIEEYIKYNTKR